jgi:hypothetical protein
MLRVVVYICAALAVAGMVSFSSNVRLDVLGGDHMSGSTDIESLKQQHKLELDGLRKEHTEIQRALHQQQEFREHTMHEEVEQHKLRHQKELDELKGQHEAELAKLHTQELNKLREHMAEQTQMIKKLHREHQEHLDTMNQTHHEHFNAHKQKHDEEVALLKQEHEDEIRQVMAAHDAQIRLEASQAQTHSEQLEQIKSKHAQALASLKAAVETNQEPVSYPAEVDRRLWRAQHPSFAGDTASFRFLIVADLDKESREQGKKPIFFSYLQEGLLQREVTAGAAVGAAGVGYTVNWRGRFRVRSMLGEAGRGLELSELVNFNGHFLTMDDRSGIVFELHNSSDKAEGMSSKTKGGDGLQDEAGSKGA